jgi:regulator of cell morphogenesis and NO signaling
MTDLSPSALVGDIASDLPGAAEVFRRHGISFCCGGKLSVTDASAKHGLSAETLLDELRALAISAGHDSPQETLPLIAHLVTRYHDTHRSELDWLIPLAQKVEIVHGDHDAAPNGLTERLLALRDVLESHMIRQEQALFPMMRQGGHPTMAQLISAMRQEHDRVSVLLRGIEHATRGLTLPDGACRSWSALYTGLAKFTEDLIAHIHLENTVLTPRFEAV